MTEAAAQIDTAAGEDVDASTTMFSGEEATPETPETPEPEKAEATEKVEPENPEKPEVPEEYTDFSMPEGVELDADLASELKALAKENGLSQDAAQKYADLGAKIVQKQSEAFESTVQQWTKDAQADKEFGGDKFQENLGIAAKARNAFGTPELTQLLDSTGLGNHPEMIRWFVRVGNAIGEDRLSSGNPSAPTEPPTQEKRLYPNMN